MVASAMTGILLTKVGRKWAMIINCVPMALGYFCLMLPLWLDPGFKVALFLVGRFLTGVGAVGIIPRLTIGDLYLIDSQDLYLGFLRQTGFVPKIRNKSRLYICQMRFVSNCPN